MSNNVVKLKMQKTIEFPVNVGWTIEPAFHFYMALIISFPEVEKYRPTLFWRLNKTEYSYFTIEIDKALGIVTGISIHHYSGLIYPTNRNYSDSIIESTGIPQFDIKPWVDIRPEGLDYSERTKYDFYDQEGSIKVEMDEQDFRIALFDDPICEIVKIGESLILEFNKQKEFCGVTIKNFNGENREIINKNMKFSE